MVSNDPFNNDVDEETTAANFEGPDDVEMEDLDEDNPVAKVAKVGQTITVTKDGGVTKKVLAEGEGWEKPENGDEVHVTYIGRLAEEGKEMAGPEFDRNDNRTNPFSFTLGKGQVIKGWDAAIPTMKKGERALITIKPEYGYGASGAGEKIPPNSTLEFEVELISWKNVNALTKDGKVTLKFIKQVPGAWQQPKDGWEVSLGYTMKINNEIVKRVDSTTMIVGSPDETTPPFFMDALKKFKKDGASGGDVAVLTVPHPHHPPVPGFMEDATVVYELSIHGWTEVEELEGSVGRSAVKRLLKEGSGWEKPKDGATVQIKVKGSTPDGTVFLDCSEPTSFVLGQNELPEAVEQVLTTMKKGEHAKVSASSDWGYGAALTKEKGLGQAHNLEFDIELVDMTKAKDTYEMTKSEKIEKAKLYKEQGNAYFKDGKSRSAARKYEAIVKLFQYEQNLSSEEKAQVDPIKFTAHLNLAACYLKADKFDKVIDEASKALSISPTSVKALYRRAQAHLKRVELDFAKRDVEKAIELDGADGNLKILQRQIQVEIKKYDEKDRKMYAKMFR
ncbi:hypothetical protein DFJ73DRAFT_809567 [Zopfochytrium polystomum]|nr:hypothetical protein DFJ73DRAFT_809567 [Zopfochytrium polystomum]